MGRGIGIRPPVPTVPGRKDGGIKLLDIADQPATHTQKKRKRMLGKHNYDYNISIHIFFNII